MICYEHHFCGDSLISSSLKFQSILRTAACQGSFATHGVKIHSTQLIGAISYHRDVYIQHTAIGDTYTLPDVCSGACTCFSYSCTLYGQQASSLLRTSCSQMGRGAHRGGTVRHCSAASAECCHWHGLPLMLLPPLSLVLQATVCFTHFTSSMHSLCAGAAGMLTWRFVPRTGSFPQTVSP